MNFNYQKARNLMVENQLKPNRIKDPLILDLFKKIPKEDFLSNNDEIKAYSDLDITLTHKRGYLKNLQIAQLINYSEINKTHKILHLGALTGYVTSLIAHLCFEVIAIETNEKLKFDLKKNIDKLNINNIKIVDGTFKNGFISESPFDRIIIDSPINSINKKILEQLNENNGKLIMIKKESNDLSKAIKITKNLDRISKEYLFDVFTKYELLKENEEFKF